MRFTFKGMVGIQGIPRPKDIEVQHGHQMTKWVLTRVPMVEKSLSLK